MTSIASSILPEAALLKNSTWVFTKYANSRRDREFTRREPERFEELNDWCSHCIDQTDELLRKKGPRQRERSHYRDKAGVQAKQRIMTLSEVAQAAIETSESK